MALRSKNHTDSTTMAAAMLPMSAAAQGCTKAHGAVMATRPASMPLAIMPGSGLPLRIHTQNMAMVAPKAAAIAVLAATTVNLRSVAAKVDAALKPNQPNKRMNVPSIAIGMWWPARVRGFPSGPYFPMRGPSTRAPASPATPPIMCTTPEPAKSV